jgi:hypothetical protein
MTDPEQDARRTLGHLKRLIREGEDLARDRPLDELAHAKWFERATNYVRRKMPAVTIPPLSQLVPANARMTNWLAPGYRAPHPVDAAMTRARKGRELMSQMVIVLASAVERLELEIEDPSRTRVQRGPEAGPT